MTKTIDKAWAETLVKNLLDEVAWSLPDLELPLPPSINKVLGRQRWGYQRAMATFRLHVNCTLGTTSFRQPKPPVVILYRCYFPDSRWRDPENIAKMLVDALYYEDHEVRSWALWNGVDKEHPHVALWFIRVVRG